jgi:hypothetical protein
LYSHVYHSVDEEHMKLPGTHGRYVWISAAEAYGGLLGFSGGGDEEAGGALDILLAEVATLTIADEDEREVVAVVVRNPEDDV